MFIVCSADNGLNRVIYEHVTNAYFAKNCLIFHADHLKSEFGVVCLPEAECVIEEGNAPPPTELYEPKHENPKAQ